VHPLKFLSLLDNFLNFTLHKIVKIMYVITSNYQMPFGAYNKAELMCEQKGVNK